MFKVHRYLVYLLSFIILTSHLTPSSSTTLFNDENISKLIETYQKEPEKLDSLRFHIRCKLLSICNSSEKLQLKKLTHEKYRKLFEKILSELMEQASNMLQKESLSYTIYKKIKNLFNINLTNTSCTQNPSEMQLIDNELTAHSNQINSVIQQITQITDPEISNQITFQKVNTFIQKILHSLNQSELDTLKKEIIPNTAFKKILANLDQIIAFIIKLAQENN